MSRLIRKLIKQEDEIVISIVRKTLWSWSGQIVITIILINLPFFLIYPLFQYGTWGVVVFFTILVIALVMIFRICTSYYYTALLITNKRLIDVEQRGIFSRSVNIIIYSKIEDVSYKVKGLVSGIFKVGDIYITFSNNKKNMIKLESVKYPDSVVGRIASQRESYLRERRKSTNNEAIKLLKRIKRKVGERRFSELISD